MSLSRDIIFALRESMCQEPWAILPKSYSKHAIMQKISTQRLAYQRNRRTGIWEANFSADAGDSSAPREEKRDCNCTNRNREDFGIFASLASELAAFQEDNCNHYGPSAGTGDPNIRSFEETRQRKQYNFPVPVQDHCRGKVKDLEQKKSRIQYPRCYTYVFLKAIFWQEGIAEECGVYCAGLVRQMLRRMYFSPYSAFF